MDTFLTPFLFILLAMQLDQKREDAVLARRIQEGDHVAFRQFFDRYHGLLLAYLLKKGMDEAAAQDIVQNAFIKIWESRNQIDPSKSLKSFLFRIGYTRMLNHFRDRAKFEQGTDLNLRAHQSNVYQEAAFSQMHSYLLKVVQKMPEKRKAVFELCFLQEFTYREASETLGVSIKTIENHMALALKTIRTAMATIKE